MSAVTLMPFLNYRVLHRIPGRLRIKFPVMPNLTKIPLPDIGDFCHYMRNHEGIESMDYNPLTGTLLILYNADFLTEKDILTTIDRLRDLFVASIPRFRKAGKKTQERFVGRIMDYFSKNPVNIRSEEALELPDEIWH